MRKEAPLFFIKVREDRCGDTNSLPSSLLPDRRLPASLTLGLRKCSSFGKVLFFVPVEPRALGFRERERERDRFLLEEPEFLSDFRPLREVGWTCRAKAIKSSFPLTGDGSIF